MTTKNASPLLQLRDPHLSPRPAAAGAAAGAAAEFAGDSHRSHRSDHYGGSNANANANANLSHSQSHGSQSRGGGTMLTARANHPESASYQGEDGASAAGLGCANLSLSQLWQDAVPASSAAAPPQRRPKTFLSNLVGSCAAPCSTQACGGGRGRGRLTTSSPRGGGSTATTEPSFEVNPVSGTAYHSPTKTITMRDLAAGGGGGGGGDNSGSGSGRSPADVRKFPKQDLAGGSPADVRKFPQERAAAATTRTTTTTKTKTKKRSNKYCLFETFLDDGADDVSSTRSFMNVIMEEEAEAGPAQPVVLSKPSYHSESTNALADELSAASEDVLQQQNTQRLGAMEFVSLTAEESAARKKELYHQNLIRTLGRKHQPSNQAAAPTGPNLAGPSFGPSLTRVTSGDEYDDDTAVADMRAMGEEYRRMGYAEKPLPDPTEEPISSKRGRKEKEGEKVGPDGISCVEVVEKQRRNHHRHPPLSPTTPVQEEDAVSELTMRSSYGEIMDPIDVNRRMAYYAVGKAGSARGAQGNRRCYFSGRLILGSTPFYAGTVRQGLRTLVVFCLPSSAGLPSPAALRRAEAEMGEMALRDAVALHSTSKKSGLSTFMVDDADPDPNRSIPSEVLLEALPEPNSSVLKTVAARFPDLFSTLPEQVQDPAYWRLYERFCHFSGLPISVGEVHYRVRTETVGRTKLTDKLESGDGAKRGGGANSDIPEVVLSHEVMLACNGEASSEIIRLPNTRCFRYLKKHYPVQCSKLAGEVFDRAMWEMVLPEV